MRATRTLLLVNFRPEYHADWMQKSWYRQIPLTPLGVDASFTVKRYKIVTSPEAFYAALGLRSERGGFSQISVTATDTDVEAAPHTVRTPLFAPLMAGVGSCSARA